MKSFTLNLMVLTIFVSVGSLAVASGFRCTSEDGYNLKIYNHVNAEDGTRIPAVFVLSDPKGTIFTAKGSEISKKNFSNVVQYSVHVENIEIRADYVIAQIRFKEGRQRLGLGELAEGNLIIVDGGDRHVSRMLCSRYKKN